MADEKVWNALPGMRWKGDDFFWPWARAHKRIVEGEENNVAHYYKIIAGSPVAAKRQ